MDFIPKVFSLSGFNRGVACVAGFAWGYAFCNPDNDAVYEAFPHYRKTPFAFLGCYKLKTNLDDSSAAAQKLAANAQIPGMSAKERAKGLLDPLDSRNIAPGMEFEFMERWKDLARYFQTQPGYLYSKLNKAVVDSEEGVFLDYTPAFHYVDTMHWNTRDYFQYACEREEGRRLIKRLEQTLTAERGYDPFLYGVVADDRDTRFARLEG